MEFIPIDIFVLQRNLWYDVCTELNIEPDPNIMENFCLHEKYLLSMEHLQHNAVLNRLIESVIQY